MEKALKKLAMNQTHYSMQLIRTKSLLSHVGLKHEVTSDVGDVVLEVTYTKSHLKEKYIAREKCHSHRRNHCNGTNR